MTWLSRLGDAIEDLFEDIGEWFGNLFSKEVLPAVKNFLDQFGTEFGKAAMIEAAEFAQQVASGEKSFVEAGSELLRDLLQRGLEIGQQDGQRIVFDALRVQLSAIEQEKFMVAQAETGNAVA